MRKALISITLATTMVATIIGCGNKVTTSEVVPNETTMETTLVVEATTESTTKATSKVVDTKPTTVNVETTKANVETTTKANVETKKVEETTTKATPKTTTSTTSKVEEPTTKATPKVEPTQAQVVEETTPYVEPVTEPQVEATTPYVEPTTQAPKVVENTTQAPINSNETIINPNDPRFAGVEFAKPVIVDPAEANKVTDIVINNGTDVWVPEETTAPTPTEAEPWEYIGPTRTDEELQKMYEDYYNSLSDEDKEFLSHIS